MQETATTKARGRSRPCLRRRLFFPLTGLVVLGAAAAFAREAAQQGMLPWDLFTLAAESAHLTFVDQFEMLLEAARGNALAWHVGGVLVIGAVAGVAARRAVPAPGRVGGVVGAAVLGLFGWAVGGLVCQRVGHPMPAGLTLMGVGVAFATCVVMLLASKALSRY